MESQHLQQIFFQELNAQLPGNISLADEVSDALRISIDGAYRRIRGEKLLSFEEIKFLASKYKISVDHIFSITTDSFSFNGNIVNSFDFTYENWLKNIVIMLENINQQANEHIYYFVKEIPFPYYFYIQEIAAFKSFFFMKSVFLYSEEWKDKRFLITDSAFDKYKETWQNLTKLYSKIPSTEIWNLENINPLINQILWCTKTGWVDKKEAVLLLEKTEVLINFIEKQAKQGIKLDINQDTGSSSSAKYNLYINTV